MTKRMIRALILSLLGGTSLAFLACGGSDSDPGANGGDSGTDSGREASDVPDAHREEPSIQLSAGGSTTCVTRRGTGTVQCWGANYTAQLGQGSSDENRHPPPGSTLPGRWAGLPRIGAFHACALTQGNEISCWGANGSGETGRDPNADMDAGAVGKCDSRNWGGACTKLPSSVPGTAGAVLTTVGDDFYFGSNSSCGQFAQGVRCWGSPAYGQTGPRSGGATLWAPNPVSGLQDVESIESGSNFACARKKDGTVWCWGTARWGEIGEAIADAAVWDDKEHPVPQQVRGLQGVRALALGESHSCIIASNGTVSCWGSNNSYASSGIGGQLGHDLATDPACYEGVRCNGRPVPVANLDHVRELALGAYHSCALREDDSVQCWGYNRSGQLGHDPALDTDGSTQPVSFSPEPVQGLGNVAHIVAGTQHTCAVTWDSKVFCWGNDQYGQLGLDDAGRSYVPVQIQGGF